MSSPIFWGKNRKSISICRLLKNLSRVLRVKTSNETQCKVKVGCCRTSQRAELVYFYLLNKDGNVPRNFHKIGYCSTGCSQSPSPHTYDPLPLLKCQCQPSNYLIARFFFFFFHFDTTAARETWPYSFERLIKTR